MKKISFILLCCSAFLVACDRADDSASEKISDVTGDEKNLLDKANTLVNDASKEASNVASEMTEKVGENIDNAIDSTVSATKDKAERVIEETQGKVTAVVDSAKVSASNAVDSVKGTGAEVVSNVSDKASNVVAAVSSKSVVDNNTGSDIKEGEKLFKSSCIACHGSGIAGSPKVGEKADWETRIAQGKEVLVEHAINGFRGEEGYYMPAKGGAKHLSDEQITMIVDYMVSTVE